MSIEKQRIKKMIQRFITPSSRYAIVKLNKHDILIDVRDQWMKDNFLFASIYEPETTRYIERHVQQGDIALDVGAHVGYHTLNFSAAGAFVYAFEPADLMFRLLKYNTMQVSTIVPIKKAVSDINGIVTFYESTRSAWSSLNPQQRSIPRQVDSIRLDDLSLSRVDWIKIDVEGAESLVLEGAREILEKYAPRLIIEWLPKNDTNFDRILEILDGWECTPLDHNMIFYKED